MAKVTGPLLSLEAQGKFKKAIIYKKGRSSNVVTMYKKPAKKPDPRTLRQLFMRGYFKRYTSIWHACDPEFRIYFDNFAKNKQMTGYNLYISEYSFKKPSHLGNLRLGFSSLGVLTQNF